VLSPTRDQPRFYRASAKWSPRCKQSRNDGSKYLKYDQIIAVKLPFALEDLKKILMPRQALLKKLDPSGSLTVPEVRVALEPYQREYECLIIQDRLDASLYIKGALKIYNYFHLLLRQPMWGQVLFGCTCEVCFPHCVCRCTLLVASLFNPEVRVPADYIAATVSAKSASLSRVLLAGNVCASSRRGKVQLEEVRFQGLVFGMDHAVQVSPRA
jgi:hypothetical protein